MILVAPLPNNNHQTQPTTKQTGRRVRVKPPGQTGVMMLRPRAWCMTEFHLHVNGRAVPGPLVDFGCVRAFACLRRRELEGGGVVVCLPP